MGEQAHEKRNPYSREPSSMTSNEIPLETIEELPENASCEDILERINFVVAVHKGLRELDEGKRIPHDKVKEEFAELLVN